MKTKISYTFNLSFKKRSYMGFHVQNLKYLKVIKLKQINLFCLEVEIYILIKWLQCSSEGHVYSKSMVSFHMINYSLNIFHTINVKLLIKIIDMFTNICRKHKSSISPLLFFFVLGKYRADNLLQVKLKKK